MAKQIVSLFHPSDQVFFGKIWAYFVDMRGLPHFVDNLLYKLLNVSGFSLPTALSDPKAGNSRYLALYNFMRNVHPALIPGSFATNIPNIRNGDTL